MKRRTPGKQTKRQEAEIAALSVLADEEIDTSDIPEILDWSGAKRGLLYRSVKQETTLRLDADVVAWFKANAPGGRGYQTQINRVLREYVKRALSQK
ncbi:MAG: BrnA antitoxin family protein [Gammaproteobacteria bacterium]|nr:BrnA antitoxin family protein [Gammaproteobacteria bacterium]